MDGRRSNLDIENHEAQSQYAHVAGISDGFIQGTESDVYTGERT